MWAIASSKKSSGTALPACLLAGASMPVQQPSVHSGHPSAGTTATSKPQPPPPCPPNPPPPPADTFIQKTRKLYLDTRTQRNLAKLNADIAEVHSIMTRNIADVLGQGERLDSECGRPRTMPARPPASPCCLPASGCCGRLPYRRRCNRLVAIGWLLRVQDAASQPTTCPALPLVTTCLHLPPPACPRLPCPYPAQSPACLQG